MNKKYLLWITGIVITTLGVYAISSLSAPRSTGGSRESINTTSINLDYSIDTLNFYIENSGSMLGYVKNANEFKETIVSMAYLPEFDNAYKNFYFINGTQNPNKKSKIHINPIGNQSNNLKDKLNISSMNTGDVRYSDLTKMFEIALNDAKNNNISILVSDCIYDVGDEHDPLTALNIENQATQQVFRRRLINENISTVIIKAYSKFNGQYYYASKNGSKSLSNEVRPYYILIFGKTHLLNKFINERNLQSRIAGDFEIARFLVINSNVVPFESTSKKRIGNFRFDKVNKNKLIDVKPDKNGLGFQFSIAVDYSTLPFPDSYLTDVTNYTANLNYIIKSVEPINPAQTHGIGFSNPTHLITLFTDRNPIGTLDITLRNNLPAWITAAHTENENNIDEVTTYGFEPLINAISGAYSHINQGQNLASFKFELR